MRTTLTKRNIRAYKDAIKKKQLRDALNLKEVVIKGLKAVVDGLVATKDKSAKALLSACKKLLDAIKSSPKNAASVAKNLLFNAKKLLSFDLPSTVARKLIAVANWIIRHVTTSVIKPSNVKALV